MIPKIIHFVWVGNNPKSDLVLKCIESWKKYCPDYTIIEWGNEALKQIDNLYVRQAFECKKWAFVSDYLRLYALYNYGGFYCDTDLEITHSIDCFRKHHFCSGYEVSGNEYYFPITTALMGAEKQNSLVKDMLDEYENISFIVDGNMDQTTNVVRISNYFARKFGLCKPYDGSKTTILTDNCVLYPSYYFCTPESGKENYSIHHFSGSWLDSYSRKVLFSFFNYKLVRFRKLKPEVKDNDFTLLGNEKILFTLRTSSKRTICLIKVNNS